MYWWYLEHISSALYDDGEYDDDDYDAGYTDDNTDDAYDGAHITAVKRTLCKSLVFTYV